MAIYRIVNVATCLVLSSLTSAFTVQRTWKSSTSSVAAREPKESIEEKRMEREKEILDMGGDPFFLTDDDLFDEPLEEDEDEFPMMSSSSLMGVAGSMQQDEEEEEEVDEDRFFWDGEVDESAYFDLE